MTTICNAKEQYQNAIDRLNAPVADEQGIDQGLRAIRYFGKTQISPRENFATAALMGVAGAVQTTALAVFHFLWALVPGECLKEQGPRELAKEYWNEAKENAVVALKSLPAIVWPHITDWLEKKPSASGNSNEENASNANGGASAAAVR